MKKSKQNRIKKQWKFGCRIGNEGTRKRIVDVAGDSFWRLSFDGGVAGNGRQDATGQWAYILRYANGDVISSGYDTAVGNPVTNNTCEWDALLNGLRAVSKLTDCPGLLIEGDSSIVIHQLTARWGSKVAELRIRRDACWALLACVSGWYARWIPREQNTECDSLTRAVNPTERPRRIALPERAAMIHEGLRRGNSKL